MLQSRAGNLAARSLPSSSYFRRHLYHASLLPLSNSQPVNKSKKTKQSYQDSRAVATHASYWSNRCLPTRSSIIFVRSSTLVSVRLLPRPPSLFSCHHSWLPLLRGPASCFPRCPWITSPRNSPPLRRLPNTNSHPSFPPWTIKPPVLRTTKAIFFR